MQPFKYFKKLVNLENVHSTNKSRYNAMAIVRSHFIKQNKTALKTKKTSKY